MKSLIIFFEDEKESENNLVTFLKNKNAIISFQYETKLESMQSKHETKLESMQSKYETKLESMQSKYETELETMQSNYETELESMKKKLKGITNDLLDLFLKEVISKEDVINLVKKTLWIT